MTKIVVAQPLELTDEQKRRLEKLGEVKYYDDRAKTPEEWLERCQGFDVICTGTFGVREKSGELHNTFVSLPFVGMGWADPEVLREHNVVIANSPGCNRYAVAEWIVGMLLMVSRKLNYYANIINLPEGQLIASSPGLCGKQVVILGKGNIGTVTGEVLTDFGADVRYVTRDSNIYEEVKNADVVIDALSVNPSTNDLLNEKFFTALKGGVLFITVSAGNIVNIEDMLAALKSGKLSYVIHDAQTPGSTNDPIYTHLLSQEGVLVTPHIAFNTDVSRDSGNDMMIQNIEDWLAGKPGAGIGAVS